MRLLCHACPKGLAVRSSINDTITNFHQTLLLRNASKARPARCFYSTESAGTKKLKVAGSKPVKSTISQADLSYYPLDFPPSNAELQYASRYFTSQKSIELSPISLFRNFPRSECPEVTVLGRSNVGKSSLLNALLGIFKNKAYVADVSKKPGRTRSMNAISVQGAEYSYKQKLWFGKRAIVLVDMPGYGRGSRDEWGPEILKYLTKREQLGMRFLLIDAEVGLQRGDEQILSMLIEENLPFHLILSKVDKLLGEDSAKVGKESIMKLKGRLKEIQEQVADLQNQQRGGLFHAPAILGCSTQPTMTCGMDGIRWAMLDSTREWNKKTGRKLLNPQDDK